MMYNVTFDIRVRGEMITMIELANIKLMTSHSYPFGV
jgi:hypothetical protein